jgi:hypothetical protein
LPVGDGGAGDGRVGIFDGPCQEGQLLAVQARHGVVPGFPPAGFAPALFQARVNLSAGDFGDLVPFGAGKAAADLTVFAFDAVVDSGADAVRLPGKVLADFEGDYSPRVPGL